MKKDLLSPVWNTLFHAVVGGAFLLSGWVKASHPLQFASHLEFRLTWFPESLAWPGAWLLAILELLLGTMLVTRFYAGLARKATATLLAVFMLYLFAQLVLGNSEPCSCYGSLVQLHPLVMMGLDLCLLAVLLLLEKRARPAAPHFVPFAVLCLGLLLWIGWTRTTAHFDGLLVRMKPGMVLPVLPSLHPEAVNGTSQRLVIMAKATPDKATLQRIQKAYPQHELLVLLSPSSLTDGNAMIPTMKMKPDLAAYFVKKYPTSFTIHQEKVETVWRGQLPPIP